MLAWFTLIGITALGLASPLITARIADLIEYVEGRWPFGRFSAES